MPTINDDIFLLSLDEYSKYKDKIPLIDESWWLRTPGKTSAGEKADLVACVNKYGSIAMSHSVIRSAAVRPVIKLQSTEETIIKYGTTWVKIDEGLYIAKKPIVHRVFDKRFTEDVTNQYNKSGIKRFLTYWLQERKSGDE